MTLIFLVSDLHLWGGGERVAILMANHYATQGVETTLLSVGRPGGVFRFEIETRVKVDYLHIPLENSGRLFHKLQAVAALRNYFRTTGDASHNLPGNNSPDCLLAIGNFPILLAAMLPKTNQLKTLGCLHANYSALTTAWKPLRRLLYGRLDCLVSLTERDLPKLRKHNPNVRIIPNPVTFYPEHPAKLENRLILAIGRIDHPKGYDLMMETFEQFCIKNSDWKLKIIGEGPMKEKIEKLALELGIAHRLTIAPSTSQIEEEYLQASIFLMTSRTEGFPMVLLEAQACGLPIVAFDCETGPAEIVHHGVDGFLVRPNDIDEISERLLELASDHSKRKQFGANARQNVKRFLPEEIFQKWDDLFDDLCT